MARKPLGLDSQGIQKQMRVRNYLADGAATMATNTLTGLTGIIVYFYTDKVGIAAAAAGTILFVAKIIDAFTDVGMGWIMDRVNTRWGRARPWLLWGAAPTFIAVVALFLVPAQASDATKFGFALATNVFATAIVYTAIAIPFGSMLYYSTRSTDERAKMGVTRAAFGYAIGMVMVIGYIPITNALGGDQRAWVIFASGFAVLAVIGLVSSFFGNKERNTDAEEIARDKVPLLRGLGLLLKNRYWVIMFGVMALANVVFAVSAGSGIYYVKWVLGDENLMAVLGAVGLLPVVVGFLLVAPMTKRFGLARTVRISLIIGIAASLVRVFFPYDLWALLAIGPLVTFATIPLMAVGGVLINNTVAYGEWKLGVRQVGMANAGGSFGAKVGNGLGVALIGWVLAFGLYDGAAAAQPTSAIQAILAISIWIPGLALVGMYLLMRLYDLDSHYPTILKELDLRAAEVSDLATP